MSVYYEKTLPEGYAEALVIDGSDGKLLPRLSAAGAAASAALITAFVLLYAAPRFRQIAAGFSIPGCVLFLPAYFLYVALHELTHGAVYRIFTGEKLTFGFRPPAAYCGVPEIYVYRTVSILSVLAPFTVFTLLYAALFLLIPGPFWRVFLFLLFSFHVSGCAGDLYNLGLLLFRFRDPATLRRDTGPVQTYYTKSAR